MLYWLYFSKYILYDEVLKIRSFQDSGDEPGKDSEFFRIQKDS